ncbi:NOG1 family protein [Salinirubellus salinus]|jgi:nucleolar GTP-binding protein|uniref:NOG1 family protein n=1 Tax=Salinirubellus salinus TaxID=1364945 RepID=A0A9E7UA57_9EURY|nr:NOG1 family protein [Salinirubellus salinus]UWM53883.1 NOG1 family protein [Salinirubellus salinus]
MSGPFENLPTTPRSEELLDKAFSRAARAGRAKTGIEAQESMLQTAGNILSDNLQNVVTSWPDFSELDPFHYELADAIVDVDSLRQALSEVQWASRQVGNLKGEYQGKIRRADTDTARKHRKQAFARFASILEEVEDDLLEIGAARDELKHVPELDPDEPAIVVAGYPNVGKTSFINRVTNARNEIASYPFTTTELHVGHVERDYLRYQLVDTPGLLDRPADERNDVERQAVSALTHLADAVLFVVDASGNCGYPLEIQLALRDDLKDRFRDVPVVTVCNKMDQSTDVAADFFMSVETGEGVDEVLDAAVEAVGYEPELPFDE